MRVVLLVGLWALLAASSHAQSAGACRTGTAQRYLENSFLRASVFNTGGLFFGGTTTSGDGYLIPKDSGNSPLFSAGLWLGGRVGGELRVAAARYGNYNFWPGPLDAASPPDDCSEYDRIYVVSRADIRRYYETGELTDDLRDWPHQLGAPVIDGDGDSTNYNLRAGDQPDLIGDMAAWWVMNDAGNEHPATGSTAPLGVEVRVLAFVYDGLDVPLSPVLGQASFYRYEILNRGDQPIEPMYASLWATKDFPNMGTDTLHNTVFTYHYSNEHERYGTAPPAQGVQILAGPVGLANGRDDDVDGEVDEPGERLGATSTSTFINTGAPWTRHPGASAEYYSYMQGTWLDGVPVTSFDIGTSGRGRQTTFRFWGDPVVKGYWSEMNVDSTGTPSGNWASRDMVLSTGPFRLAPDSSVTLFYAMPYGRGADYLQSIAVMLGHASTLQRIHADGFFASSPVPISRPEPSFELALSRVRPNPSSGAAQVFLTLPAEAHVRATVYDALGRQLEVVADGLLPEGETVLTLPDELAPGTYILRVRVEPGGKETLTFMIAR